ncbi:MAG: MFS transporter [Chloroflexi bacterium]|nr:MFS transporter [Chloroflexota bacterium]
MKTSLRADPLILPVYAPSLLLSFARGLLVPVLPLYARAFENNYELVGIALAAQSLGMLAGDVPSGVVMARLGRRRAMILAVIVIASMGFATAAAQSLWQLVIFGVLGGLGDALWNVSRHAYISEAAAVDRRGRAIAVYGGIMRSGRFVGPAIGGVVAAVFGLRAPFVLCAVLCALTGIFPLLFVSASRSAAVTRGGIGGHARHVRGLLTGHAGVWATAGTGQLLAQMVRSGRDVIVTLYAADILGLSVDRIGLIASMGSLFDVLMFIPAGIIMDRWGRKWAYVPSIGILALGIALVPFTVDFVTLMIVNIIIGFGNGIGSGTMMTLGADLAPRQSVGEFLGIWNLIGDVGGSAGPLAIGAVAGSLSLVPAIFVIAGVGAAGSVILGWLVPETLRVRRALT